MLSISLATEARAQDLGLGSTFPSGPSMSLTYRAIYHTYQIRLFRPNDPSGQSPELFRSLNPLYQTLEAGGYGLAASGNIDAVVSLRYQTDFGTGFHRDTPQTFGIPKTDAKNDFDVLYLYVDWRNVVQDRLDLRVGRQLIVDDLAWYRLDGLRAALHLARSSSATVDIEAYFGVPVRYDVLFSSPALISDGYETDDGAGFSFGGAAFFRLFRDLSFSAAYRQELTFRGKNIDVFRGAAPMGADSAAADIAAIKQASAGRSALEQSAAGFSAGYSIRPINVDLFAHATYNLEFGRADFVRAGAAFNPSRRLHLQIEGMQTRPMFAADSIFNVFNTFPYDRGRAEASFEIIPGLRLEAGYFLLHVKGGPKGPRSLNPDQGGAGPNAGIEFKGQNVSHGPSGGLTYRRELWSAGVFLEAATNFSGNYAFGGNYRRGEIFGDLALFEKRVGGTLRGGFTTVQSDWFDKIDTGAVASPQTGYYLDAGLRGTITTGVRLSVNVVRNFNSYLEGSYRVLSVLEVRY